MHSTEYLQGSFEFDTELRREGNTFVASAMGIEARHASQEQALNDLNEKLNVAMERGELVPQQG